MPQYIKINLKTSDGNLKHMCINPAMGMAYYYEGDDSNRRYFIIAHNGSTYEIDYISYILVESVCPATEPTPIPEEGE